MPDYSGGTVGPDNTVALGAIGPRARAATFNLFFGAAFQSTVCAVDRLPPAQALGPLGSIFIDNTRNLQPLTIQFPDTGAADVIPAGATSWMLAITGGGRFNINSPVAIDTAIAIQVLNVIVPPTGVQAITGAVAVSTSVLIASKSETITQSVVGLTAADVQIIGSNSARKSLLLVNIGTAVATLAFGAGPAVAGAGLPLSAASVAGDAGGSFMRSGNDVTLQAIHGICGSGNTTSICVLEGV
jgi:hypothetical protein